jgi:pimeloyl-ACP methyl ester carboxylesterase
MITVKEISLSPFVLIHGSWADASLWSGIAAELRKKGHTVYVPEYPGHGADPNKAVTHAMMTQSITDYVTSRNLKNIILVGHSFGGSLVQIGAELIPYRYMSSRLGLYRFIQVHDDHMSTAQFESKLIARKLYEASRD